MFASVGRALATLFDRRFAGLVIGTLIVTLIVFGGLIVAALYGIEQLPASVPPLVRYLLDAATIVVVVVLFIVLGAPVAAAVGSLFLDRIAAKVDAQFYPNDPRAPGASLATGISSNIRLVGLALLVNAGLLALDPETGGFASIAGVLVNGWLLGREFFELASLRHLSRQQSDALRRRHSGKIYAAGLVIAVLTVIPAIDLIAPFFGAALMAHLFKRLQHMDAR